MMMFRNTSSSIIPSTSPWFRFIAASSIIIYTSTINTTGANAFSVPDSNPPFSNPRTPEEVVQNQLFHYQTSNLPLAYSYNSPENKAATDGSIKHFEESLQTPPYNLLLNHERSDVLLEVIPDGMFHESDDERREYDTALCLVCIRPNREIEKRNQVWFWWELSRNIDDDDDNDDGASDNKEEEERWMVDCIMPDFEDLDFETDSLSIEEFGEDGDDDDDELTIYWDVGGL